MITVALSHLLSRGIRLDTAEAVAIARALSNAKGEPVILSTLGTIPAPE
jgi:isopentenyl diphosphate isomerase/L-lactate dehydrogenase-like FMN-dependent dehydrogenase